MILRTRSGIVTGRADALVLPIQRTDRVLIKIAMGLHTHFKGTPLPTGLSASAFFQPVIDDATRSIIERATDRVDFGEVFAAAGVFTDEGGSFWGMSFFPPAYAVVALVSDEALNGTR